MLKKLKIKFITINMVFVTAILLVMFCVVLHLTRSNLVAESIRMMQSIVDNPFRTERPNDASKEMKLPFFVVRLSDSGEILSTNGGYYDLSNAELIQEIILKATNKGKDTGVLSEYNLRFLLVQNQTGHYLVFADNSMEQVITGNLIKNCLIIGIISWIIFFALSFILARWAVKPVAKAWTAQKQFIADASHELKTPLTVIMTNAELLQDEAYDDGSRKQFSRSILTESKQMRGLVEDMLGLAKIDSGARDIQFMELDYSRLVNDAVLPFEAIFFENELDFICDIDEGIMVNGSDKHLRQVVEILLDNAVKYAIKKGGVGIALKKFGRNHCVLQVSNSSEAIPHDEINKIFERFYRLDKARSRNGGYGLGLSIAESIVNKHSGKIWAENDGSCTRVNVVLSATFQHQ